MKNELQYIADHYGFENQCSQLVEKMAELMVAINEYKRAHKSKVKTISHDIDMEYYKHCIAAEIADTEIMLEQVKYLLNCEDDVNDIMISKIERQMKRIKKEQISEITAKVITPEMMEYICDELCRHPREGLDEDDFNDICCKCRMGEFVNNIVKGLDDE